ncbi:hypothetical protein BN77_p270030 [Rhizobium mesoamericanum STM3625]|uniref:Transposase n=1 Tax=Rhizobium mesoamericanum STM3625 TaxID=1211777 RepID=K0Q508_9HYPH|nr:hypothetical protein BN77_p270030 [Rhizobium mesoamericanum STM3625]
MKALGKAGKNNNAMIASRLAEYVLYNCVTATRGKVY